MGSEQDDKAVRTGVIEGKFQLVLISPELLLTNLHWREMLRSPKYQNMLVGLAVDEAHCVTKW